MNALLDQDEHALHVEIQHLLNRFLGMLVEWRAPRGTGVRKQDIHMVCMLLHFLHQLRDLSPL